MAAYGPSFISSAEINRCEIDVRLHSQARTSAEPNRHVHRGGIRPLKDDSVTGVSLLSKKSVGVALNISAVLATWGREALGWIE